MLNRDWNPDSHGFEEEDFRFVSEWGFNFVRLPLDYRYWIKDGDRKNWETFDESGLRKVDAAVELGRKYGVHVQICLHRIPGYTSGTPSEPTDIFSDSESLRVACLHWRAIARRYKGVPNDVLTFNLFNEPPYIDEAKYVPVAKALIGAIRAEDGERFIIADGVGYGRLPVRALEGEAGVGFGMRGYDPNSVTHYKVPWLRLPDEPPTWPLSVDAPYGILAGPVKPDMKRPLELLSLPAGRATIAFGRVSGCVRVRFTADGRQCSERAFGPKEGGSETVELPNGAERLVVEAVEGDWIIPSRIEVESSDGSRKAVLVPGGVRSVRMRRGVRAVCRPRDGVPLPQGAEAVGRDDRKRTVPVRRRVRRVADDAARDGACVHGGCPLGLEGPRHRMGPLEPARRLRCARLEPRGRGIRGFPRTQTRPQDA